jgi:GxxExxY protein
VQGDFFQSICVHLRSSAVFIEIANAGSGHNGFWQASAAREKRIMEPQMNADKLNVVSERIIRGAFAVSNTLGCGFLEKVYENALAHELHKMGLAVAQLRGIVVTYDGCRREYAADLLVQESVLAELKAVRAFDDIHLAQCMNCLRATGLHLRLLLNFGKPRLHIKRIVCDLDLICVHLRFFPSWPGLFRPSVSAPVLEEWPGQAQP